MTLYRLSVVRSLFVLVLLAILARLFYWQVIAKEPLIKLAQIQRNSQDDLPAPRGEIFSADGFPLAQNQETYTVYAYRPELKSTSQELADLLSPLLWADEASGPADLELKQTELATKLISSPSFWLPLAKKVLKAKKMSIESLKLPGIGFDETSIRSYPEASVAAHILGFVGSDDTGEPKGYFGLEGFYDLELKGRPGKVIREKDATGKPIPVGSVTGFPSQTGRSLKLHLNRAIQIKVEELLDQGLKRYTASQGEVVIMDPQTGAIIALVALPKYDPHHYQDYDPNLYPNPVIAHAYEPGSTFKVLTMAAAIDSNLVTKDTICDTCSGPLQINQYTIRTWNDQYQEDQTMTEVIQHSDNIGMAFVGRKLGRDRLLEYLDKFGIGQPTGIDLQEEASPKLRSKKDWKDIDLVTASFGQGIAVTGIQMLRAVAAIANGGELVEPHLVSQVLGDQTITIPTKISHRVVSKDTALIITDMLVNAVDHGEAQWTKIPGYKIAGKTGTSQIPVAGHYDQEKTIASFIGFAPADNPKFVMLVKLREPQTSPWAAETAAPLWFSIAQLLLLYYNIPPGN